MNRRRYRPANLVAIGLTLLVLGAVTIWWQGPNGDMRMFGFGTMIGASLVTAWALVLLIRDRRV